MAKGPAHATARTWCVLALSLLLTTGCAHREASPETPAATPTTEGGETVAIEAPPQTVVETQEAIPERESSLGTLEHSGEEYRGFELDNVLHSATDGDIHFSLKVPEGYDGSRPYALFVTLPGWEGLYFQGVGTNLTYEDFGVVANDYVPDMIVVAPQLADWGETSARQALALTRFMLDAFSIDEQRIYLQGYSGGGETGSLVMGMEPELFAAFLHCSSQWDGDLSVLAAAHVPVRLSIGEGDEYYGPESVERTASELRQRYADEGLSETDINQLVVLDVKPTDYFTSQGADSQHGGGAALFAHDAEIMGWLFERRKR